MLEFIKENWDKILSVIGAAAWLPIIISPLINHFRKIHATILDIRLLTNGYGVSVDRKQKKKGTILLFASNIFVRKIPFFAKNIKVKVKLKNGAELNCELLDFSTITENNDDGTKNGFNVPSDKEFNISRTIQPDIDNIKYLAVLVESANFTDVADIEKIEIILSNCSVLQQFFSKKVTMHSKDFPVFNSTNLLKEVEFPNIRKQFFCEINTKLE